MKFPPSYFFFSSLLRLLLLSLFSPVRLFNLASYIYVSLNTCYDCKCTSVRASLYIQHCSLSQSALSPLFGALPVANCRSRKKNTIVTNTPTQSLLPGISCFVFYRSVQNCFGKVRRALLLYKVDWLLLYSSQRTEHQKTSKFPSCFPSASCSSFLVLFLLMLLFLLLLLLLI